MAVEISALETLKKIIALNHFVAQSNFMNEQERAEEHLKTIRRLMERATIYRAVSAPTALVGGLLSLAASYITRQNPVSLNMLGMEDRQPFLTVWIIVLLLTGATNTLFITLGARRRSEPVFSPSLKAAFAALAPALITGAVWTVSFCGNEADSSIASLLAIVWATCYGLGLLATRHFAPRSLILLGWAFLVFGMLPILILKAGFLSSAFFDSAINGPVLMGISFGLFHLIYAFCAWPRKDAATDL